MLSTERREVKLGQRWCIYLFRPWSLGVFWRSQLCYLCGPIMISDNWRQSIMVGFLLYRRQVSADVVRNRGTYLCDESSPPNLTCTSISTLLVRSSIALRSSYQLSVWVYQIWTLLIFSLGDSYSRLMVKLIVLNSQLLFIKLFYFF